MQSLIFLSLISLVAISFGTTTFELPGTDGYDESAREDLRNAAESAHGDQRNQTGTYSMDTLLARMRQPGRSLVSRMGYAPTENDVLRDEGRQINNFYGFRSNHRGSIYNEVRQANPIGTNPIGNYMSHLREGLGRMAQVAQQLRTFRHDVIQSGEDTSLNSTLFGSNYTMANETIDFNGTAENVTSEVYNSTTLTLTPSCLNDPGVNYEDVIYFSNEELSEFSNLTLESALITLPFSGLSESHFTLDKLTLLFSLTPKNFGRSRSKQMFAHKRTVSNQDTNITLDISRQVRRWISNPGKNRGLMVTMLSSMGSPVATRNFMKLQPDCLETQSSEINNENDNGFASNFMFIPSQLVDYASRTMELPSLDLTFFEPKNYPQNFSIRQNTNITSNTSITQNTSIKESHT